VVVELDGLVGGSAVLVLGRVVSDPEVDVPLELARLGVLVGLEDDVRVTGEEVAVLFLGPLLDLDKQKNRR